MLGEQRHNECEHLPKTVTRQRRGCDLNPAPPAPESSTLTTRLPSTRYTSRAKPMEQWGCTQRLTTLRDANCTLEDSQCRNVRRGLMGDNSTGRDDARRAPGSNGHRSPQLCRFRTNSIRKPPAYADLSSASATAPQTSISLLAGSARRTASTLL